MSYRRTHQYQGGTLYEYHWPSYPRNHESSNFFQNDDYHNYNRHSHYDRKLFNDMRMYDSCYSMLGNCREQARRGNYTRPHGSLSFKRQKVSDETRDCLPNQFTFAALNFSNDCNIFPAIAAPSTSAHCDTVGKRRRLDLEDGDCSVLITREEIERCSPSRKDGIDALHETRLRYSYCAFIQNLGMRLDLPQTTMGTAMVLCHRFFIRRSHACHDRFLIATATVFLAAKSEETARPLNDVLKASCEILHKQDLTILSYMLPIDWFEQYRERITEAEQLILTTLNFELSVQHPYDNLTSILNKLGVSQTHLMNLALNLVSEGVDMPSWRIDLLS